MTTKIRILTVAIAFAFAARVFAHHSMATYDSTKPMSISGTLTKVDWINPHVNVELSVKRDNGTVTIQKIQLAAVRRLGQLGFNRDLLVIGSTVTFEIWLPKNNLPLALAARTITLADGRRFDVSDNWGN